LFGIGHDALAFGRQDETSRPVLAMAKNA